MESTRKRSNVVMWAGVEFRSELEARWAIFFSKIGLPAQYEPTQYSGDGFLWTPDFAINTSDGARFLVEVKPEGIDPTNTQYKAMHDLAVRDGQVSLVVNGEPSARGALCVSAVPRHEHETWVRWGQAGFQLVDIWRCVNGHSFFRGIHQRDCFVCEAAVDRPDALASEAERHIFDVVRPRFYLTGESLRDIVAEFGFNADEGNNGEPMEWGWLESTLYDRFGADAWTIEVRSALNRLSVRYRDPRYKGTYIAKCISNMLLEGAQ